VSLWVKAEGDVSISADISGNLLGTSLLSESPYKTIEGWQKLELSFRVSSNEISQLSSISFLVNNLNNQDIYVDDLRIHPLHGGMQTTVVDPIDFRVLANLDNNNYATFYNYDSEGRLIQVKKETDRGIVTLSTGRQNIIDSQN